MIDFENITYNYSHQSGVYDIDLEIQDNEFCFLVGPTGSGKTTLLKLLYFDLFPHKGKVNILNYSSKNVYCKIKSNCWESTDLKNIFSVN